MRTRLWLAFAFTAGACTLLSTGCAVGVGAYGYEGPGYYEAYGPGPGYYGGAWAPGYRVGPVRGGGGPEFHGAAPRGGGGTAPRSVPSIPSGPRGGGGGHR